MAKILVLGIGNRIRCDDAIGIHIIDRLKRELSDSNVDIKETEETRLALLDLIEGYERVIIVDSIRAPAGTPAGEILRFTADELDIGPEDHSSHAMGIPSLLKIGREQDMPMPDPDQIVILAVTVQHADDFGEQLSPEAEAAIPKAIKEIKQELSRLSET